MITRIYLEVTSICNYKCAYCPHPIMSRNKAHMSWELACEALKQIQADQIGQHIYLNYLGEPLLYPKLFELIEFADTLNLTTHIITNGSLLTEGNINKIKNSALQDIKISYETPDEETFKLRGTSHFTSPQILAQVLNTIAVLKDTGKTIGIVFMTTIPGQKRGIENIEIISSMPQLQAEVEKITDLIATITPVKQLQEIKTDLDAIDWHWWNPVIWLNQQIYLEIRPTLNWGNTMTQQTIIPTTTGYCDALKEKMGILVNGDVVICCIDYEGEQVIGNIQQQPLSHILNSELAQKIRRDFANHIVSLKKCQYCLGAVVPN
ncbi:radical SAM/SPASM domain-containing protein [Pantanalinema sp. GBBB05]|uniref:radical SAM/SPASM domain-containing protein n=1 Tax=Pantanalinema sp. GBBB05 TaxID=2604139 RepID=UPI001D48117C|nr:radical SAM protein [Pantanalinema sp. GBBB05]